MLRWKQIVVTLRGSERPNAALVVSAQPDYVELLIFHRKYVPKESNGGLFDGEFTDHRYTQFVRYEEILRVVDDAASFRAYAYGDTDFQ